MKIREIEVKSVLTKSKLPETDYVINPYLGCEHGCLWCYSRFVERFLAMRGKRKVRPWGSFVDVKINAPQVLERQLKSLKKKPKEVFLSSVTDPYQPLEAKYKLTRQILEILLGHQIPVAILTQSTLILRDLNLFKKFKDCKVGFTLVTLDSKTTRLFQPHTAPPLARIKALEKLHNKGIETYAHIGPILPYFTNLDEIFQKLQGKVDSVMGETLNTRGQNWISFEKVLRIHYPDLLSEYQEIFFTKKFEQYVKNLEKEFRKLSAHYKIPIWGFYCHQVRKGRRR